jgi:hypothetical protein
MQIRMCQGVLRHPHTVLHCVCVRLSTCLSARPTERGSPPLVTIHSFIIITKRISPFKLITFKLIFHERRARILCPLITLLQYGSQLFVCGGGAWVGLVARRGGWGGWRSVARRGGGAGARRGPAPRGATL